jgi:hypothetical protein
MKCVVCQKGIAQGVPLLRINAKGVPGLWACHAHVNQTDASVDPVVLAITNALSRKARQ